MFNFWWSAEQSDAPPQQKKIDFFKSTLLTWPKYAPLKNLSRIWTILHKTFRTWLVFSSWMKWFQGVDAMVKTYASVNISAEYQRFCTKPSEEGSFFWTSQNESKEWYAMIKTYKNINISVEFQWFCIKPSEEGLFFQASQNESKEWYATTETYENINIPVEMSFL